MPNNENKSLQRVESSTDIVPQLDEQPVVSKKCKLCNSTYRHEAEALFERTKSYSRVSKFLIQDREEDVSDSGVRNHLKYHYISASNNQLINQFAEEARPWFHMQSDTRQSLIRTMASLDRMQHVLMAQMEGLTLEEQRKTAETVKKISDSLLAYRTRLEELDKEHEPAQYMLHQLQYIIQDETSKVQGTEAINVVKKVLERLKEDCGDLIVEQKQ